MGNYIEALKHPAAKNYRRKKREQEKQDEIRERRSERIFQKIQQRNKEFAYLLDLSPEEFASVVHHPNFKDIFSIAAGKDLFWREAFAVWRSQQDALDDMAIQPFDDIGKALNKTRYPLPKGVQRILSADERYGKRKRKKPTREERANNPTWLLAVQAHAEGKTFTQKAIEVINVDREPYDDSDYNPFADDIYTQPPLFELE